MKIAILSYFHGYGGAEKQTVLLANGLVAKKHDVMVVSICEDDCKYHLNGDVKRKYIRDRNTSVFRIITRFLDIKSTLSGFQPDITISFWFQPIYLAAFMGRKVTGRLVYSERIDPGNKKYLGVLGIIRCLVIGKIDGFVFQTESAKRYFSGKIQDKSVVITNALTLDTFEASADEPRKKVIVSIGRLSQQKNHKLVIDAFAKIHKSIPEYTLEIYGDGELKEYLIRYISEKKLCDKVSINAPTPYVHMEIKNASVFVLGSEYEGMPNALLEAMALGLPCITTDFQPGGAVEIITSGINGIIVPNNDCDAMAKAILALISDEKLRDYIGGNAKKVIGKFAPQKIFDQWESFLLKMVV